MPRRRKEYRLHRRRGTKVWYYDVWIDGERYRGSTGQRDYRAAHSKAKEEIDKILAGRNIRKEESITLIFAKMVAEKRREGKRDKYTAKLVQHGRDFIMPFFGSDRFISTIQDHEIEALKGSLLGRLSAQSVNRVLSSTRQMFKYAERHGICRAPRLPGNVSVRIHEATEKWQIVPPDEIQRLIGFVPEEAKPALVFIANTGSRTGMAVSLRQRMCDFSDPQRPRVHFPATVMKGRKKLTVDLNDAALKALVIGLARHGDRPFPLTANQLQKHWRQARDKAGYPSLRIHDLRHSRISMLLQHQVPPHVVRDMVGHCSLMVTNLYAHSTDEARSLGARSVVVEVDLGELQSSGTVTDTVDDSEGSDE